MHLLSMGTSLNSRFAMRFGSQMYRMRCRLFSDRLGWDVTNCDGEERDRFDDEHCVYVVAHDAEDRVFGAWRLRPTTVENMLRDVFSELLRGRLAPSAPDIWEISRFAIDSPSDRRATFGLNQVARELLAATILFALDRGISTYVMVVSLGVERLLRAAGLRVNRLAPPKILGDVKSVACWVAIDQQTCDVLQNLNDANADGLFAISSDHCETLRC